MAVLAAAQHGVVTRRRLLTVGATRDDVAGRLATGRLHLIHRGVYAVGHPELAPCARELAAVMACGAGAVLSHASAGAHWGMVRDAPALLHVTSTGRHRTGPAGVRVHRAAALRDDERRRRDGVPLTSPVRTLLDLAATEPPEVLGRAIDEARMRRLIDPGELQTALRPGHRGNGALRRALAAPPTPRRSEAERRLLALLAAAGLPRPETNVRIAGFEVDALWRAGRLVVEVDGYAFHSSRTAFERDRERDAQLMAAGHRVLRVTWRQLTTRPEALAARLAVAVASG